jgi:hypothetical protein
LQKGEEDPDEVPVGGYHMVGPLVDDCIVAAEMEAVLAVVVEVEVVVAGSRMAWTVVVGAEETAAGIEAQVALQVVLVAATAVAKGEVMAVGEACEVVEWGAEDCDERQIAPVAVEVHPNAWEVEETGVVAPVLEWPQGLMEHPLLH